MKPGYQWDSNPDLQYKCLLRIAENVRFWHRVVDVDGRVVDGTAGDLGHEVGLQAEGQTAAAGAVITRIQELVPELSSVFYNDPLHLSQTEILAR